VEHVLAGKCREQNRKSGGSSECHRTASAFYCELLKRNYFAAGVALAFDLALAAGAGAALCVAFRARLRSRFFALDRLRVFSRAFSFGMVGLPDESVKF
jgi:hypothetical protein